MKNEMKGQISFDYYIAIIAFIFFVVYFLFQITNLVPNFLAQMEEQRMRLEAYQVSEILINDVGSPENWVGLPMSSINRIGLSDYVRDETNLISLAKVADLNTKCVAGAHTELREKLDTDLQFSLFVIDRSDGTPLLSCIPPPAEQSLRGLAVTSSRTVAFDDGSYGELTVQMWRPPIA